MKTREPRIKQLLADYLTRTGQTPTMFAARWNKWHPNSQISRQSIWCWLNEKGEIRPSNFRILCRYLGVDVLRQRKIEDAK